MKDFLSIKGFIMVARGIIRGPNHGFCMKKGKRNRLYSIWKAMKQRCNVPNKKRKDYIYYYEKGIRCPTWEHYEDFHTWAISNGYTDGMQLHRIDNNKNYSPENCVWLSIKDHSKESRREKTEAMLARTPIVHKILHVLPKLNGTSIRHGAISGDLCRRMLQRVKHIKF